VFRISRLTDYGIIVMAHLAGRSDDASHNARELAQETHLPAPVVSKILKALTRAGLLDSIRGAKGGYRLARQPQHISVVEMIGALEGPVGITECAVEPGVCEHEPSCGLQGPWQRINAAVAQALEGVTLADLSRSGTAPAHTPSGFVPLVVDTEPAELHGTEE
jgi:FeS assembly SUF system regulator